MLVYRGYIDDTYIGTLIYMIYQRSCTDDTRIVYLHALGYIYIIYWGTQNALGKLFKKINMRHFLGSLHQVSAVCTQNI